MTTPSTAVNVLVQTQKMSDPMTSYGKSLVFDFSTQIPAEQMILAYSVALSGFSVQYATQSTVSDERVQQFAIGLVPNLVGNQVIVASNILLTDYNGDAASENQDVSGRESYAIVTVIAIIGTSPTNSWTVTNAFWITSGKDTVSIPSYTNNLAYSQQYIAGFDFSFGSNQQQLNGFQLDTSFASGDPNTSVILSGTVNMSINSDKGLGTVGLGFLAFESPPSGQELGVAIVPVPNPSWSMDSKGSNGMTATFTADITVPSGYQIAPQAAYLMSSIYLDFKDYHDLAIIAAGLTNATLTVDNNNNQVSGSLQMNLYSDEGISTYRIQSDSKLGGWVLVVFEPVS
ncbi:MAG TPA: hypothetical protein DC054_00665 [Blastocatellia bacterium]|nr:hypothetical protein [Blastocatellia bacterium]